VAGRRRLRPLSSARAARTEPALLQPLLEEFDNRVIPWARGEMTPDGHCINAVLDERAPVSVAEAADGRKAMLRSFLERQSRVRRQDRDDPSAAPVLRDYRGERIPTEAVGKQKKAAFCSYTASVFAGGSGQVPRVFPVCYGFRCRKKPAYPTR
jgi:hypothetical protein